MDQQAWQRDTNPSLGSEHDWGEGVFLAPPPPPVLQRPSISASSAPVLVAAILNVFLLEARPPWNAFLQGDRKFFVSRHLSCKAKQVAKHKGIREKHSEAHAKN
ncbi:UNVERIFIED_CONTAM: hypothetical protein K2H54_033301 [Gekko kuhli]